MTEATPSPPGAAASDPATPAARQRRARRTIALLAAIAIAPVAASYTVYYFFPRDVQVNHGTLLPTAPAPAIDGVRPDGTPFRLAEAKGQWLLLVNAGERCAEACARLLYATRQARTMQGREQDRVARVLLVTGPLPAEPVEPAGGSGLAVVRADEGAAQRLPGGPSSILVVDPLGNLVLRYPADADVKGIARDLTRLLKASRIG
jgi:hypothetical protein